LNLRRLGKAHGRATEDFERAVKRPEQHQHSAQTHLIDELRSILRDGLRVELGRAFVTTLLPQLFREREVHFGEVLAKRQCALPSFGRILRAPLRRRDETEIVVSLGRILRERFRSL
jgi:hypothetical protein